MVDKHIKTISSSWTLGWKWILPIAWILLGGLLTFMVFSGGLRDEKNDPISVARKSLTAVVWIIGGVGVTWESSGLKRLRIDSRNIYVSNYLREITLPFDAIESVEQNVGHRQRPVTIRLRSATGFGRRIVFLPTDQPTMRTPHPYHPIVLELQSLAGLAGKD